LKFLFVTPENPYSSNDGGIASYILKISELLIQNNHEVAILTLGDESKELEKEGVKYFIVKRNYSFFFKNKISKWLKLRSFLEAWYLFKTFKNSKLPKIVDVVQIANLNFVGLFFCAKKNDKKLFGNSSFAKLFSHVDVIESNDPIVLKSYSKKSLVVISSRYHGIINALNNFRPVIGTSWSHKYEYISKEYGVDEYLLDVDESIEVIRNKIKSAINFEQYHVNNMKLIKDKRLSIINEIGDEIMNLKR